MKQPELGTKIGEIRNQRGITQKELAESCNIDIRTIQRIESGDVIPRITTLKLIATTLTCDMSIFNGDNHMNPSFLSPKVLTALLVTGVIYFLSWILFAPIIPKNNFLISINLLAGIVQTITGVFFYLGFYYLGRLHKNRLLSIASIITMVCIPSYLIMLVISSEYGFAIHINKLIIILMGINSLLFGIGLLKGKNQPMILYKITGVLQILLAPFFIISLPIINMIGCWLTIPFILLLISIVFSALTESRKQL